MCDLCSDTKRFNGRVDHTRWSNLEDSTSSRTNGGQFDCWMEGSHIPCPHCQPDAYGRVTKITKRN